MLSDAAPPEARAPPTRTAISTSRVGVDPAPKKAPATAETSKSDITRGFVRAMKSFNNVIADPRSTVSLVAIGEMLAVLGLTCAFVF
jgi:hypothetical protein